MKKLENRLNGLSLRGVGLGRCPSKLSGEYGRHNQERQIIGLFIIFKKAKKMRESSKKRATAAVTPQSHFYFATTFHHYKYNTVNTAQGLIRHLNSELTTPTSPPSSS